MATQAEDPASEFKRLGNQAMSDGNFEAAVLHYTQGIILARGRDQVLASNRAFTFTRLGLANRALLDADAAVALAPDWSKAHFRRAEALRLADRHELSCLAYVNACQLDPRDTELAKRMWASTDAAVQEVRRPYVYAGLGAACGAGAALLLVGSNLLSGTQSALLEAVGACLALALLGAVVGGALHLIREAQASARLAPLRPGANEEWVAQRFPEVRLPPSWSSTAALAMGDRAAAAADDGGLDGGDPQGRGAAAGRPRGRLRSKNRSFRNRAQAG